MEEAFTLLDVRGGDDGGGEGEACSVAAWPVVAPDGREGQLGGVAVHHDEDRVDIASRRVVVILTVFDVGAHDARVTAALLVDTVEVVPAVCAGHAPFVTFDGEDEAVIEGDAAVVDAGDVAASQELCVEAVAAVLCERYFLGVHVGSSVG